MPHEFQGYEQFCWFCGTTNHRIKVQGNAIGNMVYSSHISASAAPLGKTFADLPTIPPRVLDHVVKDRLQICEECINSIAVRVGELPNEYVDAHLQRKAEQSPDIADVDMGLKSWRQVAQPFGCWLRDYPAIDVWEKYYSLDLGDLYQRGFRFAGEVTFGDDEFRVFLKRFAAGTSQGSDEFFEHVSRHLVVPNELLAQVARVRAVVYDVSIWSAIHRAQIKDPQMN